MAEKKYTHLTSGTAAFSEMMLNNNFGIVTVMNADIYEYGKIDFLGTDGFDGTIPSEVSPICHLDTLKVANVTVEGPTKTVTGGQYTNPLIKFGKTARLEMQDALGDAIAVEALCGGLNEWNIESSDTDHKLNPDDFPKHDSSVSTLAALHYGADFSGAKTIVGDTYFIDRKSGKQVPVKIVFYQFLPDSIFNLTQDAEGDATVFDMNGDLAMTKVKIHDDHGEAIDHDLFYSIFAK